MAVTRKDSARPGTASTTVPLVAHSFFPDLFVPLKVAPGAAPVAPFSQLARSFSGDHSCIRVRSATIDQTFSGGAAIPVVTLTWAARGTARRATVRRSRASASGPGPWPQDPGPGAR